MLRNKCSIGTIIVLWLVSRAQPPPLFTSSSSSLYLQPCTSTSFSPPPCIIHSSVSSAWLVWITCTQQVCYAKIAQSRRKLYGDLTSLLTCAVFHLVCMKKHLLHSLCVSFGGLWMDLTLMKGLDLLTG